MFPLVARRVPTGVAAVVTALILAGAADAASTAALTQSESSLLAAMNEVRLTNGLLPLQADARLERAARAHSKRMLRTGNFSHGAFNARIRRSGVRAKRVGENLAWGQGGLGAARTIVRMWLASPEHRANLLHPGYRIVGVGALRGCFAGRRHTLMVTTDFAGS
jgi:uncharacterized protein YkwD